MSNENISRSANLLACRQWWKVCFLYGDQEKYYRHVYGKAASLRQCEYERKGIEPQYAQKQENIVSTSKVAILDDSFLFGSKRNINEDVESPSIEGILKVEEYFQRKPTIVLDKEINNASKIQTKIVQSNGIDCCETVNSSIIKLNKDLRAEE